MRRFFLFLVAIILIIGGYILYAKYKTKSTSGETLGQSGFKSFFPINTNPTSAPGTTINTQGSETAPPSQPVQNTNFVQVSSRPIAGFTAYTEVSKTTTPSSDPKQKPVTQTVTDQVVRYISRATGYVYERRNGAQAIQVSNIYIPNIYEGYFMDNNNTAILRFLREDEHTIATYSVPIPSKNPDGTRTQKQGMFFADNILDTAVSPDQTTIARAYLDTGSGVILTSDSVDKNKKEIINTPFHEWLLEWPEKNTLYVQTKAAASVLGYLYKIDTTERKLRRVLGDINGLTVSVSPTGTYILYSESVQNSIVTHLLNTKTGVSTILGLKILPEKCTWLKNEDLICAGNNIVANAVYPDSWYAGITHFSDKLYRIYTTSTTYSVLDDGGSTNFDMTNLQVNENNNQLYFIDKNTGLLWQFSL